MLDSRGSGDDVRRRRECQECGRRFTTYETFRLELRVAKRDGTQEEFDRGKLIRILDKVTWDRPVTKRAREDLVRGLEAELADSGAASVTSSSLAERLHARLLELDRLAAARFAANYQLDDGRVRFAREEDTSQLTLPAVAAVEPHEEAPDESRRGKRRR